MTKDAYVYTIKREGNQVVIVFAGFKETYNNVNEAAEQLPLTGSMLDEELNKRDGIVHISINEEGRAVIM